MNITVETIERMILEELEAVLSEDKICAAGKNYVDGKKIGKKIVKRDKDGTFKNWSARAAQIASKYCLDPNYGRKKNEELDEGALEDWDKANWVHKDGSPCGDPDKKGPTGRCKPASKWKTMTPSARKADDDKKKAGSKKGKQYVPATKKGKVTKSHTSEGVLYEGDDSVLDYFEGATLEEGGNACPGCLFEVLQDARCGCPDLVGEAVYQGREVSLNKPTRGDVKKFKVYVNSGKKDKEGRVIAKKVNFGDPNMKIKKSNPKRRKSFRARHKCDTATDNKTARYWSCKKW